MTALRRTTTPRATPMPRLVLDGRCDICTGYRSHGNHRVCSKKRQALYAQIAKESKS